MPSDKGGPCVLHVLLSAGREFSGIIGIVSRLAILLRPRGYRFAAWFTAGSGPLEDSLREAGMDVYQAAWTMRPWDLPGAVRALQVVRSVRPDIIHLHFGGQFGRLLLRTACRAKLLQQFHGRMQESDLAQPKSLTSVYLDGSTAVSEAVADSIRGSRPVVILPGILLDPSCLPADRTAEGTVVVGTAARLAPVKGIEVLLDAIASLRSSCALALRLEISGDGPLRDALRQRAANLDLEERDQFLGWQKPPPYGRWDVFVLPSIEEGLPIVILEAMAAGLPVVATRVGGIPEIVEDGVTGFLVPPRNAGALADRLAALVADPSLRRRMGRAGRRRVEMYFSAERMARDFDTRYRELLAGSAHARRDASSSD